jgi:hypothetical protein
MRLSFDEGKGSRFVDRKRLDNAGKGLNVRRVERQETTSTCLMMSLVQRVQGSCVWCTDRNLPNFQQETFSILV